MRPLNDPLPCRERAFFLCNGLKSKLLHSLDHLLDVNESDLGALYPTGKAHIAHLASTSKVSCFDYALNSLLLKATVNEEVDAALPSIAALLTVLPLKEISYFDFRENDFKEKNDLLKKYMLFDLPKEANLTEPDRHASQATKTLIQEALALIQNYHQEYYLEMSEFISEFMLFKSEDLKAGSSFDVFGLISINVNNANRSVINMAETIIHEAAHLYLFSLSTEDPLVLNDYEEGFYSPIKKSQRPMLGLYHAVFVLTRVVDFLTILRSADLPSNHLIETDQLIDRYQTMANESLETILSSAQLTDLAKDLITSTATLLRSQAPILTRNRTLTS